MIRFEVFKVNGKQESLPLIKYDAVASKPHLYNSFTRNLFVGSLLRSAMERKQELYVNGKQVASRSVDPFENHLKT